MPPDDGCEEEDEGGGDGNLVVLSLVEARAWFGGCLVVLLSCVWCCVLLLNDVDGLRGLAVGRGVWCGCVSRSRDRLADRAW